jgi:hypothetical protein
MCSRHVLGKIVAARRILVDLIVIRLYQPWRGSTMGSSGSGRFSDYPGTKTKKPAEGGAGMTGGASGVDKCKQAFTTLLEDVGQCDFYSQFKKVPAVGTKLGIVFDKKRIFAVDVNGGKIGALPTAFNYLAACLASGITYVGLVKSSAKMPLPTVEADFGPQ